MAYGWFEYQHNVVSLIASQKVESSSLDAEGKILQRHRLASMIVGCYAMGLEDHDTTGLDNCRHTSGDIMSP